MKKVKRKYWWEVTIHVENWEQDPEYNEPHVLVRASSEQVAYREARKLIKLHARKR